ncbi:MAG: hypothetical protein JXQ71_02175 [Verrucomicrobia bacterium]|nr:hypothetical protein [Verrucomicrobiota bacterium]
MRTKSQQGLIRLDAAPAAGRGRRGWRRRSAKGPAFTLLELLVVIGIMAMIGALVAPSLKRMKSADVLAAANRQLLDDLADARRLAINHRTTVHVVFMPPVDPARNLTSQFLADPEGLATILAHQQTGYALYVERTVGDQPGREYPQYLRPWRSLPEGIFIATSKFTRRGDISQLATADNFLYATNIPVPSIGGPLMEIPYLAFNHLGQLVSASQDEIIPLARGSVDARLDNDGNLAWAPASAVEEPPNNSVDNFNHVRIDWLTGRARLERPEIQ